VLCSPYTLVGLVDTGTLHPAGVRIACSGFL
jgi:hypothetical protein